MKTIYAIVVLLAAILLIPKQSNAQVNKADSLALVDLYNYINGNQWTNNSGWLNGPVSGWYGITVQNSRAIDIYLYSNNLSGTLPSSLKNLSALQSLDLSYNHIGSTIPSSIGSITALNDLSLYNNELTGSIPSSICKLPNLVYFLLSNNKLTGKIPALLGSTGKLMEVWLSNNNLKGIIPLALGKCNLWELNLDHDQLSGVIPDTLKHCTFNELFLNYNQLSGNIPEWIGSSPILENLVLDHNKLTGTIPQTINATGLVSFSNNQLVGPVPENLAKSRAWELHLENNHFNFDGIEYIKSHSAFAYFYYAPQYLITLHSTNHNLPNVFSVSAGGTLSNNTYKWYKNGSVVATKTGDSTYTTIDSGRYSVQVTNSIVTGLTLQSDTVLYNPAVKITINNITVTEGSTGTTTPATFTIKLSKAADTIVKVSYTTADGTATAGQDYVAKSGTLIFQLGQTSRQVKVTVNGDATVESNKQFYLQLSNVVNAVTAAKDSGICTITNDDAGLVASTVARFAMPTTIQLSPNPAKDIVQVNGLPANVQSIAVVSATGAVLLQQTAASNKIKIDVKGLAAGEYFVVVKTANTAVSLPFIKL